MIGIDSQVVTYIIQASSQGYDPRTDPDQQLAVERVAGFRIFLYERVLYLTATVKREIEAINDLTYRELHDRFGDILLDEVRDLDERTVKSKTQEYFQYHQNGKHAYKDCQIVAEAELGGLGVLLTFDNNLKKNLKGRTQSIQLISPSEYWNKMNIPRGTPPRWMPAPTHPHHETRWWHWE